MKNMIFKGVIFDLDGTLVDSLQDITDSMNTVLRQNGFPTHDIKAYKHFIGHGVRNLVREALPDKYRNEEVILRCFDSMLELYRDNCINKTKMYDGISDLLDELVSRKLKLAVFSNKADELTKKIVMALLPKWDFEVIVGLKIEAHKKPNPIVALKISEKINIPVENIIYLGDTGIDMQTANNAGMYAVGVLWGFRTKEELNLNGAKYLLEHPMDLIKIL